MGCLCSNRQAVNEQASKHRNNLISQYSKSCLKKRYEFISILGNGAFGKVRLYRDRNYKAMIYAIKTMKKPARGTKFSKSIKDEVSILQELDHPNIVKYFDTFEDEYYLHIVMEYLPGKDLFHVLSMKEHNNFNEHDMADIIKNIFKALTFVHNKGIVHRDIKPSNILFSVKDDYSTLKLIDFGLSTYNVDTEGGRVGTPYYMSPEVVRGNSYTKKTDIWSVGVILYLMLTGKFPYEGETAEIIFNKIDKRSFDLPTLINKQCSIQAKDLVCRLLEKNEEERLSIEEAFEHPWLKDYGTEPSKETYPLLAQEAFESLRNFCKKSALQKEILFYMAKISKEDEVTKLKQVFNELDVNRSGTLSMSEIREGLNRIGLKVNKEEFYEIWDALDFHKDGEINYTEFLAATISSITFGKEEKLWTTFKYFEENSDGVITYESLYTALKSTHLPIKEKELKDKFEEMKKNGKQLNFEEFKLLLE